MDIVNCFRGYIDRSGSEGHICAPEVVVYRLGEGDDVQAFLFEQVGCFMGPVSAQDNQAVQLELMVVDFGIILTCFHQLGYNVEWRIINAAEYGFAQSGKIRAAVGLRRQAS